MIGVEVLMLNGEQAWIGYSLGKPITSNRARPRPRLKRFKQSQCAIFISSPLHPRPSYNDHTHSPCYPTDSIPP
jgi:hypothetical protein